MRKLTVLFATSRTRQNAKERETEKKCILIDVVITADRNVKQKGEHKKLE
jgi:hypothetical protein